MSQIARNLLIVTFAALGVFISGNLWLSHAKIIQLPCGGGGCSMVSASIYSEWAGIPTAALGLVYFAVLAAIGLSRAQYPESWLSHRMFLKIASLVGFAGFAFFTYIQFAVLKVPSPCWWCLSAAVTNLIATLIAWTERGSPPAIERHKTARLGAALLSAALVLAAGSGYTYTQYVRQFKSTTRTLDPERVRLLTERGWIKGNPNAELTVIEFSDFQCPSCQGAFNYVENDLLGAFPSKIKFVFRHFPLVDMHRLAWPMATLSEEAGRKGKFWEIHKHIYENQISLTDLDKVLDIAPQYGLDRDEIKKAIGEDRHFQNIYQDHQEGAKLGVDSTPYFFVLFRGKEYVAPGIPAFKRVMEKPEIREYLIGP